MTRGNVASKLQICQTRLTGQEGDSVEPTAHLLRAVQGLVRVLHKKFREAWSPDPDLYTFFIWSNTETII